MIARRAYGGQSRDPLPISAASIEATAECHPPREASAAREADTFGEVFLVGGAVMCLAYGARASTRDVDAVFRPPEKVREAATRTAVRAGIDRYWLNDAVKRFMSAQGEFAPFLELDHLRVMTAQPEYLLAMKCLAMRIGAEFHDEEDVRFLLRLLDVRSDEHALRIVAKYYPLERIPQKTLYALADLLPQSPA